MKNQWSNSAAIVLILTTWTTFTLANPPLCTSSTALAGLCGSSINALQVAGSSTGCVSITSVAACRDLCNSGTYQGQPAGNAGNTSNTCRSFQFFAEGRCCLYNVASSVATEGQNEEGCPTAKFYDFPCSFNTTCVAEKLDACVDPRYVIYTGGPKYDGVSYSSSACRQLCAQTFSDSRGEATCLAVQAYTSSISPVNDTVGTCRTLSAAYKLATAGQPTGCNAEYYDLPCGSPDCFSIAPYAGLGTRETVFCTYSSTTSLQACRDQCAASPLPCNSFQFYPNGTNIGTCCIERSNALNTVDVAVVLPGAQLYDFPCNIPSSTSAVATSLVFTRPTASSLSDVPEVEVEGRDLHRRQDATMPSSIAPTVTVTMVGAFLFVFAYVQLRSSCEVIPPG